MDAVDMEIDVPQESRGDSSSNDVGIPEAERSAKRPRLLADENEGENDDGSPQESSTLPPEVWARVMERKYYIVNVFKKELLMIMLIGYVLWSVIVHYRNIYG